MYITVHLSDNKTQDEIKFESVSHFRGEASGFCVPGRSSCVHWGLPVGRSQLVGHDRLTGWLLITTVFIV